MIKVILLLKLVFIISVQGQAYWNQLRCRVCERAESFDRCNTFAVCSDIETSAMTAMNCLRAWRQSACYMDKIIDGTRILFNGGCRSKNVCMLSGKKRKRDNTDLVSCSRCCDATDFCNDHLCGLKPVSTTVFCNSCDGKDGRPHPPQYPEDCPFIKACEPDEVCFSSMRMEDEKTLSHYTTCEKLEICRPLTNFILQSYRTASVGKREETICSACCGDNYCNKYACETTKKIIFNVEVNTVLSIVLSIYVLGVSNIYLVFKSAGSIDASRIRLGTERLKYLNSQGRLNSTTLKEIPFFG